MPCYLYDNHLSDDKSNNRYMYTYIVHGYTATFRMYVIQQDQTSNVPTTMYSTKTHVSCN